MDSECAVFSWRMIEKMISVADKFTFPMTLSEPSIHAPSQSLFYTCMQTHFQLPSHEIFIARILPLVNDSTCANGICFSIEEDSFQ